MLCTRTTHTYDAAGFLLKTETVQFDPTQKYPPGDTAQPPKPSTAPSPVLTPCTDPTGGLCYPGFSVTDNSQGKGTVDTVRSTYRELTIQETFDLRAMKNDGQALIDRLVGYRERAMTAVDMDRVTMFRTAIRRAEEAVMWATKAITT